MIEDLKYNKSLLQQASKYIEDIKCLDECQRCGEVIKLLNRFPYLGNTYFAMGMDARYKSSFHGFPVREGEEILGCADPYLGHLIETGVQIEDLCTCDFYYNLVDKRAWAICLFACGYYIESMILTGKTFDLDSMKRDKLFLSIFGKLYAELSDKYSKPDDSNLDGKENRILSERKKMDTLLHETDAVIDLVRLDINYVPKSLLEKMSIIKYILKEMK